MESDLPACSRCSEQPYPRAQHQHAAAACTYKSTQLMRTGWVNSSRLVQVDVILDVCCPANSTAMSMPVISSSSSSLPP